jgi:hypothetical protein
MRNEIYVVTTELDKKQRAIGEIASLEVIKSEIVHEFGGLTEIPNCKGYWEESTQFYKDNVEIWLIYASATKQECLLGSFRGRDEPYVIETDTYPIIEAFAKRIKKLTYQKVQAFTIDGKLYLI